MQFEFEHAVVVGQLEAALRRSTEVVQERMNALAGDLPIAAVVRAENTTVVTHAERRRHRDVRGRY